MTSRLWRETLSLIRAAEGLIRAAPPDAARFDELRRLFDQLVWVAERGRASARDGEDLLHDVVPCLCSTDMEQALRLAVDLVIRLAGAERGVVAVEQEGEIEVVEARASGRRPLPDSRRQFSNSIIRHVMRSGKAVRLVDASRSSGFADAESVSQLKLLSVLAVPFRVDDRVRGAVYLENRKVSGIFTEATQGLVAAFAGGIGRAVRNSCRMRALRRSVRELEKELGRRGPFEGIIGRSPKLLACLNAAALGARSHLPILIEGETGTGKELIARGVHAGSPRAGSPLVGLNCAAVPEALLEDELFGHVRGAFTGAERERQGLFATADQGTLFLDEVAEMSTALQAKLLRVLEYGEYRSVGGDDLNRVDIRLITATACDLEREVAAGRFREDLYYRLRGVRVRVPPLRERREDIPLLLDHFLEEGRRELGCGPVVITPEARRWLVTYDYPGNVRELRAALQRAILFADDGRITVDSLPHEVLQLGLDHGASVALPRTADELKDAKAAARAAATEKVERAFCEWTLKEAGGNVSEAARRTGLNRSQFQQMLARLGLRGRDA